MPAFTLRHDIPPVELAPGVAMSFKVIPPVAVQQTALANGHPLSFMMGSRDGMNEQRPRHRVIIPQPFYLGEFPVTQTQFACFRKDHQNHFAGKPNHPVESVSWHDAQEFLRWLKQTTSLPEEAVIRLPWEAEWEYACRAGSDTICPAGDGYSALEQLAWIKGNSGNTTHSVGEKLANSWGLHDMLGNVWEWCGDVFDPNAYAKREYPWSAQEWMEAKAGEDAVRDDHKVPLRSVRGASWLNPISWCGSSLRYRWNPSKGGGNLGFRVFLSPPDNSQGARQPI
jgi:formylglycine-generating enzyme required for sulfatase activity